MLAAVGPQESERLARYARAFQVAEEHRRRIAAGEPEALDALLARHPDLRDQLAGLLAATGAASPEPSAAGGVQPVTQPPAPDVDGYRILRLLGHGGMGQVWLAERRQPRHNVALKVIRVGMDTEALIARFDRERQALALMNHDAIARVLDAGTTDRGQPWFAMELIENGQPLLAYCDERMLSVRDRIGLFEQLCDGVQHAHQKGVIHRDLKPTNVLAAEQGGRHVVKIIDFGIARPIETSNAAMTEAGIAIGTPEYMSPEQAGGDAQRVDTRTDVYSLGVLLYELLAGTLPFTSLNGERLDAGELQRRIRDEEPRKPSTAVQPARALACAKVRGTTPRGLQAQLRGDLDWIVLRAMAKEPDRRYQTVADLASDLRRHLAHEPVLAGPPSTTYRLRKFARKHRALMATAATIAMTALAAFAFVLVFALETRAESQQRKAAQAITAAQAAELAASDGRFELALQHFDAAIAAGLGDPIAMEIGRYYALEGLARIAESTALLQKLAQRSDLGRHWATIHLHQGANELDQDLEGGLARIRRARDADARDSTLTPADREFAAGMLATEIETITQHLQAALRHQARHLPSLHHLAGLMVFRGKPDEALAFADRWEGLMPSAYEPRCLRVIALASSGRFAAAKQGLAELQQQDETIATFLKLMIDAFVLLEKSCQQELQGATNVGWQGLQGMSPPVIPVPPRPYKTERSLSDAFAFGQLIMMTIPSLAKAIGPLQVAKDRRGLPRLRVHPWLSSRYGKDRMVSSLLAVAAAAKSDTPLSEEKLVHEALVGVLLDLGPKTGQGPPRNWVGATASLPAVRRLAGLRDYFRAAHGGIQVNSWAIRDEGAARLEETVDSLLALDLGENEFMYYAFMAINWHLPRRWYLAEKSLDRWAVVHGQTNQRRMFTAEIRLAQGLVAEAKRSIDGLVAGAEDHAWLASLQERLAK
jgi:serine/threonine protein kinase